MKRTTATILALITLTAAAAQAAVTTVTLSGGEKIVISYTGTLQGVKVVGGNETLVSIETAPHPTTPAPAPPATLAEHSKKQETVTGSEQQTTQTAPTKAAADTDQKSIKWSWARPKVED